VAGGIGGFGGDGGSYHHADPVARVAKVTGASIWSTKGGLLTIIFIFLGYS